MKLQMKNQLTFQTAQGYEDDPCPVTEENVKEQFRYWVDILNKHDVIDTVDSDLGNLISFLANLADSEIEYTDPAREYKYIAGFEYNKQISVLAYSQDEADKLAMQEFTEIATWAAPTIGKYGNVAKFSFKYLERDEPHDFQRIFEC